MIKNNNNQDIVIDEDGFAGPELQKTEFYKNLPVEICLHLKRKESYPYIKTKTEFKKRGININNDAAKYFVKWNQIIVDTFFPVADDLGRDPLVFADEKFIKCMGIVQKLMFKNKKEIRKIEQVKEEVAYKIDNEIEPGLRSIIVE